MKINPILSEVSLKFFDNAPATAVHVSKHGLKTEAPVRSVAPGHNNPQDVESTLKAAQLIVNGLGLGVGFYLDKSTGTRVIQVVDLKSGEVVRQIPPKEVMAFLRQLRENKEVFVSLHL